MLALLSPLSTQFETFLSNYDNTSKNSSHNPASMTFYNRSDLGLNTQKGVESRGFLVEKEKEEGEVVEQPKDPVSHLLATDRK